MLATLAAAANNHPLTQPNHDMNWYYAEAGQQKGPVNETELQALAAAGTVKPDTLVWHEGLAGWQPYAQAAGGAPVPPVFPTPGNSLGAERLNYAGFWIRFGAKFLDGIIVGAVEAAFSFAVGVGMGAGVAVLVFSSLVGIVLRVAYNTYFIGAFGATPGKMACGLKVVAAGGGQVSYPRAFGRACAEILSGMICLIGFIMAAFDDEKRTLHDRICETRVVHK